MTGSEKKESVELLLDLLRISSVNGASRETDIAEFLQQYFSRFGIECRLQYVDDERSNIIADIEGENPDILNMWNGHLDTVPCGNIDEWKTDPLSPVIAEGRIHARGASDMKSGLAAMVSSLCQMKAAGKKPYNSIRFIGTCDEEQGGTGALRVIEEKQSGYPAMMIIGEPTDCNIGIAQKGCLWIKLAVKGKTSHGAYPEQGINAVESAFEIYRRFKDKLKQFRHPCLNESTVAVTSVTGGIAPNMIPDRCELTMDVRIVPGLSIEKTLHILEQICEDSEANTGDRLKASFLIVNERPAVDTDTDDESVLMLKKLITRQGLTPELLGINYFTDASVFIKAYPEIPVLLFGPGSPEMAHKPDEYVEIEKYYAAVEIYKELYGTARNKL